MRIFYLTGFDRHYFWMAGGLISSFARWVGDQRLHVCDFGLTESQRRFLGDRGMLLAWPASVPAGLHPWQIKSKLADYVPDGADDAYVWLDSDMIVVDGLAEPLAQLLARMERTATAVAAAPNADTKTIRRALATGKQKGRDVWPFERLIEERGIDRDSAYLNTGIFVCTSRAWLDRWRDLSDALPMHYLFDQSSFNTLAHAERGSALILEAEEWNVHGRLLAAATVAADAETGRPRIACFGRGVKVLHATSDGRFTRRGEFTITVDGRPIRGGGKVFRDPVLAGLQLHHVETFVRDNLDLLVSAGVLDDA